MLGNIIINKKKRKKKDKLEEIQKKKTLTSAVCFSYMSIPMPNKASISSNDPLFLAFSHACHNLNIEQELIIQSRFTPRLVRTSADT